MIRAVTVFLAGALVLPLAGCQAPVHMFNMIVPAEAPIEGSAGKELSVEVGSAEGGEASGFLNDIRISDLDLREAIINSLAVRGALARGQPDFRIDAEVILGSTGTQEILMGLNVTTTVDMRWLVTEPASGDRVFSRTLTSTGTASSSEYFNPTERIQVATERAIQENIRMLIATLYSLKR
ncbi:hypothetical protein SAE02_06890 [Skermanella aerolata]|uniref:Lipoprotein n=1 Tax=Skermanella aerolata TaxID=393310 RepID=A0A512DJ95_9PROT|nr:hypothetical protein SAE02_06890 [Skermanella aerolata]